MVILLLLAFTLSIPSSDVLLKNTSMMSEHFHEKCLQILPTRAKHHASLASLVCGEKITDQELKIDLSKTSLIHIFVVSGSHLLLIDELLSILKIPVYLRFLFLGIYSLLVGWQAPAVRALCGLGVRILLLRKSLPFPNDLIVALTGFGVLTLFPAWWNSLSFLMSWCAALALCWPSLLRIQSSWVRAFVSQISIFLFMSAPLWGLGSLHPLSVIYNLFLAPVVSYILLPLGFIVTALNSLTFVFDFAMDFFIRVLPLLSEPIELKKGVTPTIGTLWGWIFSWHIIFHFLRLRLWQGRDSQ